MQRGSPSLKVLLQTRKPQGGDRDECPRVYTQRRDEANQTSGRCRGFDPMSSGRQFPIRSFVGAIVLVAVAAASVYLSYELVVEPRRALENQIREQKEAILKLGQENQRLEAYLKILKHIDRRAMVEVLRQAKDQQGNLQT